MQQQVTASGVRGNGRPASHGGSMIRFSKKFAAAKDGQTAVEFGLILVPFFALLFSIFENGFLLMVDDGVAQANSTAARQMLIGNVQNNNAITSAAQYRDSMICSPAAPMSRVLPSYIDCSQIVVDVRAVPVGGAFFSAAAQAADFWTVANSNKFCTGDPSGIVMVRVMYPMPAYFPIITTSWLAANGVSSAGLQTYKGKLSHIVLSTAVFQNEPFASTGTVKPGC